LRSPEKRPLRVRLLGGLVLYLSTLYCGPLARTGRGRGPEGGGLYPELAVLGFSEGASAALSSQVGRQCALLPSYELARQEVAAHGPVLGIKVVHRLARTLGAQVLTTRLRALEEWRAGRLLAGTELAGKRVAAMVDGGRTRLRRVTRKQKGKGKKKKQRRRYQAEWREPKVLILLEIDEQGRLKKGTRPWLDGTFAGPDEALELLAFHLHRLGAAAATAVVFVADGAPWVWDRLEWVRRRVGLSAAAVTQVLDFCHAAHHLSLALEAVRLPEQQRRRLYRKLKQWLRRGWPGQVVDELERLGAVADWPESLTQPLAYLRKHMEARRLDYGSYRRRGLPLGSGAVESAIRRVVNLRLKGPGLMWLKDNAEGALALRAAAVSSRWEETMRAVREAMGKDRRIRWEIKSADLLAELNTPESIKPPAAQSAVKQEHQLEAA
jgi:hypothetical protein